MAVPTLSGYGADAQTRAVERLGVFVTAYQFFRLHYFYISRLVVGAVYQGGCHGKMECGNASQQIGAHPNELGRR
ncbi:hypothetical protein EMIT07CA2_60166 [Brevibacillus sp. IT-7CA2]